MRIAPPERVEDRRLGQLDGVARPGRRAAPAVEDDQDDRPLGHATEAAAAQIGGERLDLERGAADERAVHVGLPAELGRIVRLDRAAVEDRDVEDPAQERVRLLGDLGRGGLARADRPDRLVGERQPLVRADLGADRVGLPREHLFRPARLALLVRLAHARDHAEAGLERGGRAASDALVRLAEELTPLRVPRQRAVDAELQEHPRRDLARERALVRPVDVLREHGDVAPGERLDGRVECREGRADGDLDALHAADRLAQRPAERRGLGPRLVHLPVAGDEHRGES